MKTAINNQPTERFEFAKRILASFQVLIIGVMFPVLFVAGVTKQDQKQPVKTETPVSPVNQFTVQGLVDFGKILSDQNG
jgi:hypothetical protein